jgi:hypothetical protein
MRPGRRWRLRSRLRTMASSMRRISLAGWPARCHRRRGRPVDSEEREDEHGEGDVAVPTFVAPDLVVVQTGLVLGGLEALLDRPPGARDLHQPCQRDRVRGVAEVEGQLRPDLAHVCGLAG